MKPLIAIFVFVIILTQITIVGLVIALMIKWLLA